MCGPPPGRPDSTTADSLSSTSGRSPLTIPPMPDRLRANSPRRPSDRVGVNRAKFRSQLAQLLTTHHPVRPEVLESPGSGQIAAMRPRGLPPQRDPEFPPAVRSTVPVHSPEPFKVPMDTNTPQDDH